MPEFSPHKLRIRNIQIGSGPTYVLLCDEDGRPFHGQRVSNLESECLSLQQFTVTFLVDGTMTVADPSA